MLVRRWIAIALAALLAGFATGGWTAAEQGVEAAAEPPVPEAADQQAAGEEPSGEAETPVAVEESLLPLPAAPPRSLQTLVDERRDLLRERRRARFDLYSGRYLYTPPGFLAYDATMDSYRDAMRTLHRRQRDYARLHHDAMLDSMVPWSRPQRERSQIRSYLIQMEQLDRQEADERYLYGEPFAFAGPLAGPVFW
jgi:hypothetical protein